jgi:hypothetical protein
MKKGEYFQEMQSLHLHTILLCPLQMIFLLLAYTADCYQSRTTHESGGERYMEGTGNNQKM